MGVGGIVVSLIPTIIGPVPERRHCSSVRFARPKVQTGMTSSNTGPARGIPYPRKCLNRSEEEGTTASGYISPQQLHPTSASAAAGLSGREGLIVCGIVGVVFGALGFVLSFIPIINNIAAIFSVSLA